MEKIREEKKYDMIDNIEQVSKDESKSPKELTENVIETITALVHQAGIISEGNNSMQKSNAYKGIGNPDSYIKNLEEKKENARNKYNNLEKMKKAQFWTIGRNKAKTELTQEVLIDIIDAIDNNADATKALFNNQIKLSEFSNKLYGIGLMGIASNRIVVREIKLRLENASKEELSDLARQELEYLFNELNRQQRIEEKINNLIKGQEYFMEQSKKQTEQAFADMERRNKEETENLRQQQMESLECLKTDLDDRLKKIDDATKVMEKNQEQFIKESKEAAERHYAELQKKYEEEAMHLHKEQDEKIGSMQTSLDRSLKNLNDAKSAMADQQERFMEQSKEQAEQAFAEVKKYDNIFKEEQQDVINKLVNQITYYKITAISAGAISIASALYTFLI